jgi:hypothetical protein
MKKRLTATFVLTSLVAFMVCTCLLLACGKDTPLQYNGTFIEKCKNIVCFNGGTCVDGICSCPQGYDSTNCSRTWNSRYTGTYDAFDECFAGQSYQVTIAPLINDAAGITIRNITKICTSQELTAKIASNKTNIEIPLQKACDNNYMSGTGTQTDNGSFINLWLTTRDTLLHTSKFCTIVLRKR